MQDSVIMQAQPAPNAAPIQQFFFGRELPSNQTLYFEVGLNPLLNKATKPSQELIDLVPQQLGGVQGGLVWSQR